MKKSIFTLVIGSLFFATQLWADTLYEFEDTWINFKGYTSPSNLGDEYGNPKINGLNVLLDDNGLLKRVEVELKYGSSWLEFNSLFINAHDVATYDTSWDDWDFLVHDGEKQNTNKTVGGSAVVPDNGIYRVKGGDEKYDYSLTINDGSVRKGNPNGIQASSLYSNPWDIGSGWTKETSPYLYAFDFTHVSTNLGQGFDIAFAPYCANDVIGGTGAAMNPVPEPATLALLGLGLLGLAGIGRKKQLMN